MTNRLQGSMTGRLHGRITEGDIWRIRSGEYGSEPILVGSKAYKKAEKRCEDLFGMSYFYLSFEFGDANARVLACGLLAAMADDD